MSGFELDSSAINPEADNLSELPKGRLLATSGHSLEPAPPPARAWMTGINVPDAVDSSLPGSQENPVQRGVR